MWLASTFSQLSYATPFTNVSILSKRLEDLTMVIGESACLSAELAYRVGALSRLLRGVA